MKSIVLKNRFWMLLAFLLILGPLQKTLSADPYQDILVLHSYHPDFEWTEGIHSGLLDELADKKIHIHTEFMDTKFHEPAKLFPILRKLYTIKYADRQPEAVICTDNNAFDFLILYRHELFPDVPVIFCGVNNFEDQMIAGHDTITGIVESINIRDTLNLILRMHPETRKIAVLSDITPTDNANHRLLNKIKPEFADRLQFITSTEITPSAITQFLEDLDDETVLLFFDFYRDADGNTYTIKDGYELIKKHTDRPIYSLWLDKVKHGGLGGVVASERQQGKIAAQLLLKILNGQNVSEIPIERDVPYETVFNFSEMQRFKIRKANLPENSIVINEPEYFFYKYRHVILIVGLYLVFISLAVIYLWLNVQKRKVAEKRLKIEKDRAQLYFDMAGSLLIVLDHNGYIIAANKQTGQVLETSVENLTGKSWIETYIPEKERNSLRNVYDDLLTGCSLFSVYENEIISEKGTKKMIRWHNSLIFNELAEDKHLLCSGEDITDIRDSENKLTCLQKQLFEIQKLESIGQLAGGIAHDLNNLLTPILGYSELVRTSPLATPDNAEAIEEIHLAAHRAKNLVKQLLLYSRREELRFSSIQLNDLLTDFYNLLRRTIRENITIKLDLDDNLNYITGDSGQLEQVLMNLAVNSQDAISDHGEITFKTRQQDNDVVLEVSDSGHGIPSEILDRIFEPFFTTKDQFQGTGLGLSSVFGIIQQHHGDINVNSIVGKGTTFTINLPQVSESTDTLDSQTEPGIDCSGTERILLVEDEYSVKEMAHKILSYTGYSVLTAENGVQALNALKKDKNEIHLLITDVIMPEMNGTELVKNLRQKLPELPVLYISGYAENLVVLGSQKDIKTDILKKPFTAKKLCRTVRDLLDRSSL